MFSIKANNGLEIRSGKFSEWLFWDDVCLLLPVSRSRSDKVETAVLVEARDMEAVLVRPSYIEPVFSTDPQGSGVLYVTALLSVVMTGEHSLRFRVGRSMWNCGNSLSSFREGKTRG